MGNEKVTRITLTGSLRGSLILREAEDGTEVRLSLSGRKDGLVLLTLGEGGVTAVKLTGSTARAGQRGIRAAALASKGRLYAVGFSAGVSNRDLAVQRLRLAAAETEAQPPRGTADQKETGGALPNRRQPDAEAPPRVPAAATEEILRRARALFGALTEGAERETYGDPETPDEEPIPNPFPRTFPNSVWTRRPGERRLKGRALVRGVPRELTALPAARDREAGPRAKGRLLISKEGARYLVFEE